MSFVIAQISDFHITEPGQFASGIVDTPACLARCVAKLMKLDPRPDAVLATGDLVDLATEEEYIHLRALLAPLTMPVFVIPGNHDHRDRLRAAFADHAYLPRQGFLQYTVDDYPVRLIAFDTVIAREGGGELCAERLAWLDAKLAEALHKPTVVVMHHPPFATGIKFTDEIGLLRGGRQLGTIIERNAQVERIVCGHLHRSIHTRWHGTLASTCPSTAHQIPLSLATDAPEAFNLEPPGFQLHLWIGTELITHTAVVNDYPGPYAFA